jgi:putative transferase (TIGR04331 family)
MSLEKDQFIFYDFSKKLNLENRGIKTNDEGVILQNSKTLMKKSNLIIVNYLSTSYIEAILMDIPTIFFWNKENYFLKDKYGDFYNELINVGICQTDPIRAANFISKIWDNPEIWWNTDSVKQARINFISKNLGDSSLLSNYLLNLL